MKSKETSKPELALNEAAERIAIWAQDRLTKWAYIEPFPLPNLSLKLESNAKGAFVPVKLNIPPQKNRLNSEPVPESVRIQQEMRAVCAKLHDDADMISRYFSYSVVAEDLAEAIVRLINVLVPLARKEANALHGFYECTLFSAWKLESLAFLKDSLPLVQAEASKQDYWPVPYSPDPFAIRRLETTIEKIGLGKHHYRKLVGVRRSHKSLAGIYAERMGSTLAQMYFGHGFKFYLSQQALGMETRHREEHLSVQGWRVWMTRLCQLPELTQDSAPAWFEIGWQILKDATGGNVASNPELAELGKSNADYARRNATTSRGQLGKKTSRIESQIKKLLRKAFLARFGNPTQS